MVSDAISENWRSSLIFVKGAKSTPSCALRKNITPALVEMKEHFKNDHSFFNNMVHPSTLPKQLKSGVAFIFQGFGVRKYGLHYLQTCTLWTSQCGQFWRKMPVLHPIKMWSH